MKKLLLLLLLTIAGALAAQTALLTDNGLPIRQGYNIEWTRAADSVDGGVVYVWSDTAEGGRDLYAQKVDAAGNSVWDGDNATAGQQPVTVDNKLNRQEDPVVIGTTDGGVIVAWVEYCYDSNGDIFAQKLDANGNKLWNGDGVALCRNNNSQLSLNIVPDAAGGAYIVWEDGRGVGGDIYGTHVTANGTVATGWTTDGSPLATGYGTQGSTTLWQDEQGGAVMGYLSQAGQDYSLYAIRMAPDGTITWNRLLVDAEGSENAVKMCPDGTGNFFFAWLGQQGNLKHIYVKRVAAATGADMWPEAVQASSSDRIKANPRITKGADNSAIVCWEEQQADGYADISMQKVANDGSLPWGSDAHPLVVADFNQRNPRLVGDDNGGVVVIWDDGRLGSEDAMKDIYIQHVSSTGTDLLTANGMAVCDAANCQIDPLIKRSGGNYYMAWGDLRNNSVGIYYQVLNNSDQLLLADNGVCFRWGLSGDVVGSAFKTVYSGNGYWLVWEDNGYVKTRVMMQKINADNTLAFAANGIPVAPDQTANQYDGDSVVDAVTDGNGGIYVAWIAPAGAYKRIFWQHVSADGTLLNPAGMTCGYHMQGQRLPKLYYNAQENACYMGWSDARDDEYERNMIYAQKLVGNALAWGDDNVRVASISSSDLFLRGVVGNYYIYDDDFDIYVQHLNSDGTITTGWPTNGITLTDDPSVQSTPVATLVGDNLFVAWTDKRNGQADAYGQLIHPDGTMVWGTGTNGIPLMTGDNDQFQTVIASLNSKIYMALTNGVAGDSTSVGQVSMQRVDSNTGLCDWTNAIYLSVSNNPQENASLAVIQPGHALLSVWEEAYENGENTELRMAMYNPDGPQEGNTQFVVEEFFKQGKPQVLAMDNNVAGVAWADSRSSGKTEIVGLYAQKYSCPVVATQEQTPTAGKLVASNYPNPFNPSTTISYNLPQNGQVTLNVYNSRGQRVRALVSARQAAGQHTVTWNGTDDHGRNMASGVYFYKVETAGSSSVSKMLLVK